VLSEAMKRPWLRPFDAIELDLGRAMGRDSGVVPFNHGKKWLNDDRRLSFGDGGKSFCSMGRLAGVHEVLSLGADAAEEILDLSSDDRTIYFSRIRFEADIWMVTLDEKLQ